MFVSLKNAVAEDGVYILETRSNENSSIYFEAFMNACPSCKGASVHDAQGDGSTLKRHAKAIVAENPKLVVASGFPAIEAIASRKSKGTPLIASLTTRQKIPSDDQAVFGIPTDFSIDWAFYVTESLFGEEQSIVIVSSLEYSEVNKDKIRKIEDHNPNISVLLVKEPSELPDVIQQAYRDHSIVIFGKDSRVVNRQSIDFIRSASISYNRPTIVHSASLVGKGFPLAISPDMSSHGFKAGAFADRLLKTGNSEISMEISDFTLLVDCKVLSRNQKTIRTQINPCSQPALNVKGLGNIRIDIR